MASGDSRLELVTFGAGGRRWAVEAALVGAQVTGDSADAAPSLVTVLGLAATLGLADAEGERAGSCLWLRHGGRERFLAVAAPVELLMVEAAAVHPLPGLVAARGGVAALRALVIDSAGMILVLDGRWLLDELMGVKGNAGKSAHPLETDPAIGNLHGADRLAGLAVCCPEQ